MVRKGQGYWSTEEFKFANYIIKQNRVIPKKAKVIISFMNNEDRALGLFGLSTENTKNIEEIHLIFLHRSLEGHGDDNINELISKVKTLLEAKHLTPKIHYLNFYAEEFSAQLFNMLKSEDIFSKSTILDLTSCPSPVIVPLSEILLGHMQTTITIAYTLPETYNLELMDEIEKSEVSGTMKIYGSANNQETSLAIIAGFENDKAIRVVDHVKPDIGYLFNNMFTNDRFDIEAAKEIMLRHQNLIKIENFKQFHLPRYDTHRIFNTFELLQSKHENSNIIIAPFGSKIQRLCAIAFVSVSPNRSLIDIIPEELSFKKISSGIKETLYYQISRKNRETGYS